MRTTEKKTGQTTLVQGKLDTIVQKESRTGGRRYLQTLQQSAVDKENLVCAGRNMKDVALDTEKSVIASNTNVKSAAEKKSSIKSDLTGDAASEHYWQLLAEKRRLALEEALKENEGLHAKVKLLEEENAVVKEMMKEATDLVQTLTEIVQEKVDDDDDLSFNISM